MSLSGDTRISHVHLRVRETGRVLRFYAHLLGFKEVKRFNGTVALSATGQPPFQILLTESSTAKERPPRSVGLFHTAIRFPGRKELAKILTRLVREGYALQGAADHGVSEALYLADPEGNGVELYSDRPAGQWQWDENQIQMVTEPLDVTGLLDDAENETWREIDSATDIGHVHLSVSSLRKAERFYRQVLGFDVTSSSYPGALFLSAGKYHHHIGANIWQSRGSAPHSDDVLGLASVGLSVSASDIPQIRDRAQEQDLTVELDGDVMSMSDFDGITFELSSA